MSGKSEEAKKVVVLESRSTAIRRCLVHLAPIVTSTAILTANLRGVYFGVSFAGHIKSDTIDLMLFQVAAKGQEILVVASLGAVILHVARQELLYGDGLPLGLVGSGLSFNNGAFFVSKEFYGSLQYLVNGEHIMRRVGFVALLASAGVIAVLVGPASATLLVPRAQEYAHSRTSFMLQGDSQQLWPADVSADLTELRRYCAPNNSTDQDICPGAGFRSLWEHWSSLNYTNFISEAGRPYAKQLSGSSFYWPIHSPNSQIPPLYTLGDPRSDNSAPQPYTWLVQSHAASATVLQQVSSDWWKTVLSRIDTADRRIDDRHSQAFVPSAFSGVSCTDAQNLSSTAKVVEFPTIEGRWDWSVSASLMVESLNTTPTQDVRFHWVHLPSTFGPATIGSVIESPWSADGQSRAVVGCTAQLGWVPTDIATDAYTFWSGWYPWGVNFGERFPAWTAIGPGARDTPTNGRVAVSDEWLELLTPPATSGIRDSSTTSLSTIEILLNDAGLSDISQPWNGTTLTEDWTNSNTLHLGGRSRLIEAIMCSVLADGLSRSGSYRAFDTDSDSSHWPLASYDPAGAYQSDSTEVQGSMYITGYAYRTTLAQYLSMTVLLVHITIAVSHMVWVAFQKRTSRSWSSVAELIALAYNSRPELRTLVNAGAGINKSRTFARMVKIRARRNMDDPGAEHVELVFQPEPCAIAQDTLESSARGLTHLPSTCEPLSPGRNLHIPRARTFPLTGYQVQHRNISRADLSSSSSASLLGSEKSGSGASGTVQVNCAYG